jgi:hypothetical protein
LAFLGRSMNPSFISVNREIKESNTLSSTEPLFALTATALVAGRDNKHLDFRLPVLKVTEGVTTSVVVSTVCTVHNLFGKVYLFFVVPFHKWGVQWLISKAISAGRL